MNTDRFALSSAIFSPDGCTFGNHPLGCRSLKDAFTTRPLLAQYHCIWDVATVLKISNTTPIGGLTPLGAHVENDHADSITVSTTLLNHACTGHQ